MKIKSKELSFRRFTNVHLIKMVFFISLVSHTFLIGYQRNKTRSQTPWEQLVISHMFPPSWSSMPLAYLGLDDCQGTCWTIHLRDLQPNDYIMADGLQDGLILGEQIRTSQNIEASLALEQGIYSRKYRNLHNTRLWMSVLSSNGLFLLVKI